MALPPLPIASPVLIDVAPPAPAPAQVAGVDPLTGLTIEPRQEMPGIESRAVEAGVTDFGQVTYTLTFEPRPGEAMAPPPITLTPDEIQAAREGLRAVEAGEVEFATFAPGDLSAAREFMDNRTLAGLTPSASAGWAESSLTFDVPPNLLVPVAAIAGTALSLVAVGRLVSADVSDQKKAIGAATTAVGLGVTAYELVNPGALAGQAAGLMAGVGVPLEMAMQVMEVVPFIGAAVGLLSIALGDAPDAEKAYHATALAMSVVPVVGWAAAIVMEVLGMVFGFDRESVGEIRYRQAVLAAQAQEMAFGAQTQQIVDQIFPSLATLDELAQALNSMQGQTFGMMGDHPWTFDFLQSATPTATRPFTAKNILAVASTPSPVGDPSGQAPQARHPSNQAKGEMDWAIREKLYELLPGIVPEMFGSRVTADYPSIERDLTAAWATAGPTLFSLTNPYGRLLLRRTAKALALSQGASYVLTAAQEDGLLSALEETRTPRSAFEGLYDALADLIIRRPQGYPLFAPGSPWYIPDVAGTPVYVVTPPQEIPYEGDAGGGA